MKNRLDAAREILRDSIARWTIGGNQNPDAIPTLSFFREDGLSEPFSAVYEPCICMVVQGAKRVILGNLSYVYNPHQYLIASVDLPTFVQVIDASKERPLLGLKLTFDMQQVSQMLIDSNFPHHRAQNSDHGMATSEITLPLVTAFQRLIDLLDEEQDIPMLAPIIQKEIIYLLLVGEQGACLHQIATAGSQSQQVARTIEWLKSNFSRQLRIDDLASQAHMSTSSFHNHFRAITAQSPLQYQKHLRLHEARRLMLAESLDAATAAFQVGYESPSQFSREYSRLFGTPPIRDITKLRKMAIVE
ncbi:AraC family transcriptional regulator [Geomonas silvestris]|uniref:AraC family transcriptional regulator n=1 Tax=Geomonas silvestris TaxID=2740184 RepID=A0A6V8MLC3_9BACT|nr:AraC family transcriptional regulator [Geomonas silvestris]GFO60841.1 AraC family transcriptional regulator [Geomonas silvestris]